MLSFKLFRRRGPVVTVELKEAALKRVYVYEDENLKLEVPVPPLDVFLAFVRELDKLGPEAADAEGYVTILARAFWLLHQRPKETGFLWRPRSRAPKVDEDEALKYLEVKVKNLEVALLSLPSALFGLVRYVVGGRTSAVGE